MDNIDNIDLIKFGLIPEFISRIPIISILNKLSKNDLFDILTKPKNALIKHYQKLFQYENVELEFDKDALIAIANIAFKKNSGARGLTSIIENLLLDIMFDIPNNKMIQKIIINSKAVEKKENIKIIYKNQKEIT
jgi:ATP-dependent Clp protease ATP-binding subunit ClpX